MEDILITGISELDCYPPIECIKCCKQCIENDFLWIPDEKPDIESINEIKVSIDVEDFQLFNTILGPKIMVNGVKKIKVIYTANNCQQSLHSAHWCIPFCQFTLLKDSYSNECFNYIKDVFIGLENVCVKYYNRRNVDLSILFVICPY